MKNTKITDKKKKSLAALTLDVYAGFFQNMLVLEHCLKNRLYQLIKTDLDANWFNKKLSFDNGDSVFAEEKKFILRRKPQNFKLTDKGLLVESGFGLWVEFYGRRLYASTHGLPIKVFSALPNDIKRKDLYTRLKLVKELRNEIYHSRMPLALSPENEDELNKVVEGYTQLRDLLNWLDGDSTEVTNDRKIMKAVHKIQQLW